MTRCECGNESGARFCGNCGARLQGKLSLFGLLDHIDNVVAAHATRVKGLAQHPHPNAVHRVQRNLDRWAAWGRELRHLLDQQSPPDRPTDNNPTGEN